MGFFQQFPYIDTGRLNIDWVLQICSEMEDALKNMNHNIENVIRPIIAEQQQFIKQYYNTLLTELHRVSNDMDARVARMEKHVNSQLYNNVLQMNQLNRDVMIALRDAQNKNELTVTKYKQEIDRLLTFYDAKFQNMITQSDNKTTAILREYENKFNAMITENKSAMDKLQLDVSQQLQNNLIIIDNTRNQMRAEMAQWYDRVVDDMDSTLTNVQSIVDYLYAELDRLEEQNTNYYKNITTIIYDTRSMLETKINLKADTDFVNREIARIEDIIHNIQVDMTIVVNPTTGEWSTVQQALDDLYDNNRPWALTAEEYDSLGLRASEFDDIANNGMTAYNYDYLARWFLIYKFAMIKECKDYTDAQIKIIDDKFTQITDDITQTADNRWDYIQKCCNDVNNQIGELMFMYSPFDGKFKPIKHILQQMFEHLYGANTLSAIEYDNLNLSAQQFDDSNITAYLYDWNGKEILGGI